MATTRAPAVLRGLPQLLIVHCFSLVFVLSAFIRFLADVVRKGPRRMFCSKARTVRPALLDNPKFGSHQFVRLPKAGIKLHCVVNGPADKPLMLMLHGFPECWFSWRHQLTDLSSDYRVVAYDMRGYGESDKPENVSDYIIDTLADDIDELITELGYDKCILVGMDWGGIIALTHAALYPHRIQRLITLNSPHPTAYDEFVKISLTQLRKSWYVFTFQCPVFPQLMMRADDQALTDDLMNGKQVGAKPGVFTPDIIEVFKYQFKTYKDWSAPMNYYKALMRYKSAAVGGILCREKIKVPTLMIWATGDGAVETKLGVLTSQRIERCKLHFLEGTSHWVQHEEPAEVNRLIRLYLADKL